MIDPTSLKIPQLKFTVHTREDYFLYQQMILNPGGNGETFRWASVGRPQAQVNYGRWLFDCGGCRAGVLASREWGLGLCCQCGGVYEDVEFPENAEEIEAVLGRRPNLSNQNWTVGETLKDLERENDEHL